WRTPVGCVANTEGTLMDTTTETPKGAAGGAVARLAIDGGTPVRTTPFPRRILVGPEERAAVLAVLDREAAAGGGFDRYGGQEVDAYEREFAAHMGTAYATATSSGTAAIHTALAALR